MREPKHRRSPPWAG